MSKMTSLGFFPNRIARLALANLSIISLALVSLPSNAASALEQVMERYTRLDHAQLALSGGADNSALSNGAIENELRSLQLDVAQALLRSSTPEELLSRAAGTEPITIQWLGVGSSAALPLLTPSQHIPVDEVVSEAGIPDSFLDGATWMDGFSEASGNEFRIRIPAETMAVVTTAAEAEGVHLGFGTGSPVSENDVYQPQGISSGFDSRVLKGSINRAQTSANLRKLFQVNGGRRSGCSGVLVGPKHNLTAAHCVWTWIGQNQGRWSTGTLRAGRNGTAWRADASISSNRWYWVPSQYRASSTDPTAGVWDIGMFVTHGSRMGEDPGVGGWFGYVYYTSNSGFEYYSKNNRGYPACGLAFPPADCRQNHMYGDTTGCGIGGYSSSADPWGIPRRVKHSCDTSGGMSGSPLYEFNTALGAWVVSAIHTGYDGTGSSTPNYATRITRQFADSITWLRRTFP